MRKLPEKQKGISCEGGVFYTELTLIWILDQINYILSFKIRIVAKDHLLWSVIKEDKIKLPLKCRPKSSYYY